jgi:hypothetical protein
MLTASLFITAAAGFAQQTVQFQSVKAGWYSKVDKGFAKVFQNEQDFDHYWDEQLGIGRAPTGIKWGKEQVVAINLGHRGSAGYSASVYRMTVQNEVVTVDWVEQIPGSKGGLARPTSPWVVVRMPYTTYKLEFRKWVQDTKHPFAGIDAYPVTPYLSGEHSLIKDELVTLVEDKDQLASLWLTAFGKHTPPPKNFDFNKYCLAAIMLGDRPTGGYGVNIDRLARIGPKEVQIQYSEARPAKGAVVTQTVTQPFVLLRLPRNQDNLSFVRD